MKRRGGGKRLTQERREKGSGVDEITDGASPPGKGVQRCVGGGEGDERAASLLLRAWGGPGPRPGSKRGETEEVTLPSPGRS